ncbi:hypothetical protein GTZ97_09810 [Aquabacterium fontiphilum]|uniref:caspase family protein n=1 Tax=Aquabacterium fontiphilum TaxID=450365 RepID=UPI001376F15F|nr:caspase family protein [Aquabacterium fontiphilum]NBD20964.1 hypothetical protein [Aquabacterium fontiphilum]
MNIAILIGISNYLSEIPLPACKLDAENMRTLLSATRKYDDIQIITDQTTASQVKDSLRSFFAKYQDREDIEEAFIYFSGHGLFQNDALLCCSDFDSARPATTSISNAELDDLLRSVKPNVAVKIIDACQSGSPYIKDANAGFEKALGRSQLKSFICMASSRQDQSSYASATESFFTSKWIEAALSKREGAILYRDIQAALADAFVTSSDQTPFFVNQGSGLEVFCHVGEDIRSLHDARTKSTTAEKPELTIANQIEIEVRHRDSQFVPHEQVLQAIESTKTSIINAKISDSIVSRFYSLSAKIDGKLAQIPKSKAVATFADEQGWPKRYFAKVSQEAYKVRVPKDPIGSILSGGLGRKWIVTKENDDEYIVETRYRPSTLEVTESLPMEVAELSLVSQHPSLPAFNIYIGLVHSLTDVMVLSATVRLTQKGWNAKAPELSEVQWKYQSYPWRSVVADPDIVWREAARNGELDIRKYLESLATQTEANAETALVANAPPNPAPN